MKNKKMNLISFVLLAFLLLYSAILLYEVFWGVVTSLKTKEECMYSPLAFPEKLMFENYAHVFKNFKMRINGTNFRLSHMLINTVVYTGLGALIASIIPFVVAYITARYNFWFCKVINAFVIIVIALPIVGATPSTISILQSINIYDTFFGAMLLKASFLNMYYLVFHAGFLTLPKDFHEAASIDGASELRIMLKIMFPMLVKPFLTVLLIFSVDLWNDYQGPILFLYSRPVLARGVFYITTTPIDGLNETQYKMASSMILLVPIVVVFSIFSKRLMGGVSMGGIKE